MYIKQAFQSLLDQMTVEEYLRLVYTAKQITGIAINLPTPITRLPVFLDMVASFGCLLLSNRNDSTTFNQRQTANGLHLTETKLKRLLTGC